MFPLDKVKTKREFDLLYKKGKMVHGNFFSLRFLFSRELGEKPRYAVIISTKTAKSAVVRNKKKRQVREILRKLALALKNDVSFIVNIKEKSLEATFGDMEKDLGALLKKAGLTK